MAASLDDYRWLISEQAERWLAIASSSEPLHIRTRRLRRELSVERAHLALEQVELRRRARVKFRRADQMFFTPRSLEQASEEGIARYKASKLGRGHRVADLCCGVGGDLIGLAQLHSVVGVDQDEAIACLAEANLRVLQDRHASVVVSDVIDFDLREFDCLHIDPDRRRGRGRTVHAESFAPDANQLTQLLGRVGRSVVKLAPATPLPSYWEEWEAEREWIGSRGECRQQLLWRAEEACTRQHRATLLGANGELLISFVGEPDTEPILACGSARYVFEPQSAILAAGLSGALAQQFAFAALGAHGYLTGDEPTTSPAFSTFRVLESLPFDRKRLRSHLREQGYGPLEIKKRGVAVEPSELRRWLKLRGDRPGVLLLFQQDGRQQVIVAERVTSTASD